MISINIQITFSPPAGNGSATATAGTVIACIDITGAATAGAATAGAVIQVLLGMLLIARGV